MSLHKDGARASAALEARFDAIQSRALTIGAAGLVACLVGAVIAPAAFFPAYLTGFLFWASISVASIGLCFLHRLVGGGWALPLRRPFEAGAALVVLMAIFFIPVVLGLSYTFAWTDEAVVKANEVVAHKVEKIKYLTPGFFTTRAVIYFAFWTLSAFLVNAWSRKQDESHDDAPSRRLTAIAGPFTVFMFLSASFAAFDWGMSRDPDWYSTIYGAMFTVGMILTTMSFMVIFVGRNSDLEPFKSALSVGRLNDLGNLLLAFTMLWAYMSFSQFLITWLGNLPEEVIWYLRRTNGVWGAIALGLIAFGFFAPFLALLQRTHKRDIGWVVPIASWIILMRVVDLFWLIVPGFSDPDKDGFAWGSLLWYAATLAGIGGIWVSAFVRRLRTAPLVPLRDPRIIDAMAHDHHSEHEHTGGAVL